MIEVVRIEQECINIKEVSQGRGLTDSYLSWSDVEAPPS